MKHGTLIGALAFVAPALAGMPAAAVDEIQVYDAAINDPGQFSLQMHGNYAVSSRTSPDFAGGMIPDGAFNGTPEFAYGLTDWWEIGAYVPYAIDRAGKFLVGGVKLRTLFVSPHADDRDFFYGMNFEFSYSSARFSDQHYAMEARPIIGVRTGPWDFIVNPILDVALSGPDHTPEFEPSVRIAYNFSKTWAVGLEHYAILGPIDHVLPVSAQQHNLFAVVDYSADKFGVDFGVGHGFTPGSDDLIVKFILNFGF